MLANPVIVLALGLVLGGTPSLVDAQTMDNLNPTSKQTQSISDILGLSEISFDIDDESERFISDDLLEWEVNNFKADIKKMCNSDSCTFTLDDAEFRENSASYAYVIEGILKVGTELTDGSKETNNYELWGSMDRIKTIERADGTTVEDIFGTINIDMTQATLNRNPDYMILASGNVTRDLDEGTGTVAIDGFVS